jgi:hypothetical protein
MIYDHLRQVLNELLFWISAINNFVSFFAILAVVVTTLFSITRPYIRIVKTLLCPLGYKLSNIFVLLWYIRGNPSRLTRIFVEICIVKSAGEYQPQKGWWRERLKELIELRRRNAENVSITLSNCSPLTENAFSKCIGRYFDYLHHKKRMKKFHIAEDAPLQFVCSLAFAEGALLPISLVSGLMSRYSDDWQTIIEKFVYSPFGMEEDEHHVLPNELYFTFAWLLWGPSYTLRDQQLFDKLIQYAYGDESNSINMVMKNDSEGERIWRMLNSDIRFTKALVCSVNCHIYESKGYVRQRRHNFSSEARYFIDKIAENANFICECNNASIGKGYKALNYYCTAYVWIMFELVTDNDLFDPLKTVAFFEHSNLANAENAVFLEDRLVDKAIHYFVTMFQSDEYSNRHYRFCLSFNASIFERFYAKYNEIVGRDDVLAKQFRQQLELVGTRTTANIFGAFDDYFDSDFSECEYIEVDDNDETTLALLGTYYTQVYCKAFPDPNLRESLDNMLEYLAKKRKGWYGKNNYRIVVGQTGKSVTSGIICDYFAEANAALVEFIAVKPNIRTRGHGNRIFTKAIGLMNSDAVKARHGQLDWVICEMEDPSAMKTDQERTALHFWRKMGFCRIDGFQYIQPALSPEKEAVDSLILIAYSPKGLNAMPSETLGKIIINYAYWAMRITEPGTDPAIKKMISQLETISSPLQLMPLP